MLPGRIMKNIKIAAFLLFTNICVGSFLKSLNASQEMLDVFYFVILAYVVLIGLAGAFLLLQIVLLTFKLQVNEKAIRNKINEMKKSQKMTIESFYKAILKTLDLNTFQKEIIKAMLKIGISFRLLSKN